MIQRRVRGRRFFIRKNSDWSFNIVSLMDIFTFLLFFLLKAFSVNNLALKPPADMSLPFSQSSMVPPRYVTIDITQDGIYLEKKRVHTLSKYALAEGDGQGDTIFPLRAVLKNRVDLGELVSNSMIIRADKSAPFEIVWKVMFTARQLGFDQFQNLTIQQ